MSPEYKGQNLSEGLTLWIPTKALLWIRCQVCSTFWLSHAFYNIQKLNLSSKTDISKPAWIYPWWMYVSFLITQVLKISCPWLSTKPIETNKITASYCFYFVYRFKLKFHAPHLNGKFINYIWALKVKIQVA